ncbi:hypothetical protein DEU56DRAFT_861927 [Suillus clintonianus]|uniref:uncharacterized protein n=1 Tax=Suillus clintonianus TaxID=1904413 RepID=UPI001B87C65C|nr:uncharacterized protein DEU56DRAFT_861927 [Suillus clintonianus]KAG2127109.1 hypothetical protein DEU56DRAFT_861927 [Suillus clintonianus]
MTIEPPLDTPDNVSQKIVHITLSGPPTREELLAHYPAKFTWDQLKTFVNSGYLYFIINMNKTEDADSATLLRDLGLLKRDRALQKRYDAWSPGIVKEHGSMVNYLINHRLQWGQPDTLSLLPSALDSHTRPKDVPISPSKSNQSLPPLPPDAPEYFKSDIQDDSELISIIQNDWPYSVPIEIEHTLIWSRVPVFHMDLIPAEIDARIQQDGLCGFTGNNKPPPSPSTLPECLPALAEWGITMENLVRSPRGSPEIEEMVRNAGREIDGFVKRRWVESEWETAWFVNPPRLQSVRGLAHIHVFAKKKHL